MASKRRHQEPVLLGLLMALRVTAFFVAWLDLVYAMACAQGLMTWRVPW